MKAVYHDSSIPEKEAKSRYFFPENLMMENAAASLQKEIDTFFAQNKTPDSKDSLNSKKVLILCGSGNNGGDGLALARRIHGILDVNLLLFGQLKTSEAKTQLRMAQALGVSIAKWDEEAEKFQRDSCNQPSEELNPEQIINHADVIVDCIFGTGFHGELPAHIKSILEKANKSSSFKIACDIPSGLFFNADLTVTMGALKSILFTDKAKEACGKIKVADLGISPSNFEKCALADAYLIEQCDIKLPFRNKKSSHKGSFGHTAVIAGQKSGAAIIAAEAALNFGSGLTSLVESKNSNLCQFKISPELMISKEIPSNTSAILLGPGLGKAEKEILDEVKNFLINLKKSQSKKEKSNSATFSKDLLPALILDADMLSFSGISSFLQELYEEGFTKIILTPHPKELASLYKSLGFESYNPSQAAEKRFEIAEKILNKYPNLTLVLKSANTLIAEKTTKTEAASKVDFYIVAEGSQALAKGGSGDVLAGMISSLLAQGYSTKDAAISSTYAHALASKDFHKGRGWDLSPHSLISKIKIN
ncbi:MAG: NAD(P)H-hydrate dehydratase [Treponema sp.]|nr:NAD(P)H-hydrate dehydratase [Treponema sp.]